MEGGMKVVERKDHGEHSERNPHGERATTHWNQKSTGMSVILRQPLPIDQRVKGTS